MADLKFRTGASATVQKENSLEKKLAGIMGTTQGAIKSLESQLRREHEAEEARKKAEEEARKKAEAAAAANAAARAEADNKARLADLLTAANRAGVAQSSKNAKMVAFGEGETGAYTAKPTMTVREKAVKPNLPALPTVNAPVATPPAKGDVEAVTLADEDVTADIDDVKGEINTLLASKNRKNETAVNAEIARLNDLLYAKEQVKQIEARNAEKREAADEAERQQQAELDRFQKYDAMDAGQMEGQIRELENRLKVVEDSIAANDRKALEAYQRGEMVEYNRYENERVRLTQMRDALEDELRALNDAYAQKAQFDQEYSAHDKMLMRNIGAAQTRMDVAADAAQKNAAYIQAQGVKLGQLESKIKSFTGDPSSPEYAALINEYNVAADLYNQAVELSSRRDAQLVDSIGAYYDALDARETLDPVYRQSYEKAIGLTAQIDGLQRQLDELYLQQKTAVEAGNTGAAEVLNQQISAIDEQIMALMKERAPLADYAYTYDMTRTLDELPENDLYLFRSVASEDYSAFTAGVGNPEQARAQLLEKYSEKEFDRILGYVQRQYNAEKAAQRQEKYEQLSSTFGGAVLATVASVVTNVIGAPGAVYEIVKQGLENSGTMTPYDTNAAGFWAQNATRGLRGAVSEQINNPVGEFVYQTLTSAIDSAAAMALAGASGGVLLGVSAAANSMQDIAERGGDLGQIVAGGVMAGVFEGLFEQYSIGNFYALKDVPTTTYRDMARNILTSAGVNAQEEAATELANIMYDFIALGDASNYAIRLRELMTQEGLTEAQAKKALAMESATQIALAAASGALMGVGFGATGSVDSYIRVQRGEVVQPDDTEVFRSYMTTRTIAAAYLPADRRPNMSYVSGRTTQDDVEYYAQIVLDRMKEENRKAQQEREADREAAQLRAEQEQERAEIKVRTLQTAAEVAETAEDAEASANTDAAQAQREPVAAALVQQAETAAVMPQEVRNARAVSNAQTAQNVPVSFDTDDVSAFVAEEAAEVYESLSMYEGAMLDGAVQDEARALRQEGREDVAAALEQIHRDGGVNYGDSIGQRRERDAGESAGGEAGTVAEGAGSDQSRDVQTGLSIDRRTAAENSGAEKVSVRSLGLRNGTTGATVYDITDTTKDPELVDLENDAKLAGADLRFVVGKLTFTNGVTATGIYDNGAIVVTADDAVFSATQIANHELYHWIHSKTPGMTERLIERLKQEFSEQELNELIAAYEQLYAGTGATADMILEEICADMYAGMVREQYAAARDANLPTLTGEARRIVREKANASALGERDANGTRAGPEENRESVNLRFSVSPPAEQTDSDGNTLSEQQAEYFAESQARDAQGRLLRLYHQTGNLFTVFDTRREGAGSRDDGTPFGIFLKTSDRDIGLKGKFQMPLYANITNPLRVNNREELRSELENLSVEYALLLEKHSQLDDEYHERFEAAKRELRSFMTEWRKNNPQASRTALYEVPEFDRLYNAEDEIVEEWTKEADKISTQAKEVLTQALRDAGYDGVIINTDVGSFGRSTDAFIALDANQVKNTDNFTPTDSPDIRFSISDDTVDTLNTQLEETEQEIDRLEALMGNTFDSTLFLQIDEAKAKRSAIYEELRERHARAARQAARENDEKRAAALEEIRLIEDHAKELSREASAERAAYKADGDAQHLANAERLRAEAAAERAKAKPMRERAGIEDKREFRPIESKRQTTNRILDLFKVQAGRRAEMRRDLNVILDRTLLQGYVTDSDLESLLHAMYDAGVDVVQPDAAYEDVAKTVRGTTLYISEEVRREFGDDWREMQRALTRAGIKTSLNSSERGIDSLYGELAEGYPGLFDGESTDMRAMLEDIVEAAQLGKAQHRSLAAAAQEIGLSSDEDFAALYSEVRAELRSFADRADMEVRFRENLLKDTNERNAQRLQAERERFDAKLADLRKTYADSARRASERRQRSEQMTKIRNALKRLNRASERNDQTLTKILSRQTPEVQQLMNRVRDEISTVANRLTDRKLNNLLELKQLYEDRKANDPNFIPNPATEKALERVGMVHLNDLSVEDLQALYDTVTRIAHDFDEANRLIGEGVDQQLDNAGMEMIDEIEFAKGSSAKGNAALWLNERSLSPSRALLRYVGYDRSGIMGKLVESLEKGDIDAMGYTLGADMIFKEFVGRADVRKWLKTAAGEDAEMIELEVPRILEWGEGDTPIFDQKNGEIIKDKVYLTKMMVVNMARDMKNEQNLWHIKYGGYTFPDAKLYKKGKLQEAYARSNSKAVRMSPEFVRQIVDEHLDKIGKEYVELLDQYYDQFSKEKVNGVSRQLDGVDKAISDSYNPIRTSKAFRAQNYNVFDGTIEGMGSLKNRQHFAGNPIVLADADETMRWHRDNMSRYVGYAIPMRNFKALMNYSKSLGEETIRAQIETKYGANAGKFLDDLAKIIEEGKLSESEGFTALDKLTGKYVSRVLGFNISSMLKQLSALSTAGTSHGFGVVNHALATPRKVDVELIRKYTPYYDYRGAGYTYAEVANLVRDTNAQQSKALQAILGKNWLEATDLWVNRRLWLAAEYVVQKRGLRPGTQAEIDAGRDPYYKAVAEVFNRMTHDTQTNYNTMSRPIALRSTNLVVRMATMFKTDALQLQGIARESFGAYQTAKRKFEDDPSSANRAELQRQKQKFINGAVGIVSASIMQSILEMVAKLVRGDDDDYRDENGKLTLGTAGKEIAKDTLYSLVGCVIFGDQIADMISALITDEMLWEPDIPSVSALYDMYEDVKAFGEQAGEIIGTAIALRKNGGDADAYWKANWDVFAGEIAGVTKTLVSYMTGLAIPNMEKTVLGLINHAFPQIPIQYSDYTGDFAKGDLVNLEGEALEAALHAYLTDEVGELGETAEEEILRLYELYGNKALPGANAPTSVKEVDENGNEIERKPTLEELGNWDVNYRLTFIDAMGDIIGSETYNALSDAEKLKLIAHANEYARDMAKEAAGIPVDPDAWVNNVKNAANAGIDLSSAIYFYAKASTLVSDKDENGKTIEGSKALKELDLLDSMDASKTAKRELLEGVFKDNQGQLKYLDTLLDAGYDIDGAIEMFRTSLETGKSLEGYIKYLDAGLDRDAAEELYETLATLEPEDGKTSVVDAQRYEAIVASGLDDADKWTAFADMLKDTKTGVADMEAVRAAGGTPEDYAELRSIGGVDAYLRGVEAGLDANTALRVVNAVAALPDLPEGESYGQYEKAQAAMPACQTPEQQIKVYAMYHDANQREAAEKNIRGAYEAGIDPEVYLEYKINTKDLNAKDENGETVTDLKKARITLVIDAMDLTNDQKDYLWLSLYAAKDLKKTPWHTGRTYSSAEEYVKYL